MANCCKAKINDHLSVKISEENKCMNYKEEGHFRWACPKGDICRLGNLEGHIAMDCPTYKTCRHCGKKGHPERRCFYKPEAFENNREARIVKDKGTEDEAQEDPMGVPKRA